MARVTSSFCGLRTVDQHSQAVISTVGCRNRMACSPGDRDGHLVRGLPRSSMRCDRCTLGDASPDLASGPRTAYLDGLSRPNVTAMTFEKWQQVIRAVNRPGGKETVIGQRQRTPAVGSDKSLVTHWTVSCLRTTAISGSRPNANHANRFYRESAALLGPPVAPGRPTRQPDGGVVAGGRHSLASHRKIEAEPSHDGPSGSWSRLLSRSPRDPVDRPQDIEHRLDTRQPR